LADLPRLNQAACSTAIPGARRGVLAQAEQSIRVVEGCVRQAGKRFATNFSQFFGDQFYPPG